MNANSLRSHLRGPASRECWNGLIGRLPGKNRAEELRDLFEFSQAYFTRQLLEEAAARPGLPTDFKKRCRLTHSMRASERLAALGLKPEVVK
jgi:hypothetical protein